MYIQTSSVQLSSLFVRKSSNAYRKEREEYFIRKFNTVERGMNRKYYKDKEVVGRF